MRIGYEDFGLRVTPGIKMLLSCHEKSLKRINNKDSTCSLMFVYSLLLVWTSDPSDQAIA